MYKYLLWDIDGTVLDFLASERYAICALFETYGFGTCSEEMLQIYSKINVKYWEALERNEMTKPEILVGRFREFFQVMGLDVTKAESFNQDYQSALGDHLIFVEHAQEMLREEKGDYFLAAVTNGTKVAQTKKLKRSGLDQIFDAIFISEDVGVEKPNVEFFDHVFQEVGITDRAEVLIIGDSLTGDMKGGENAGIDTCWYNPNHLDNKYQVKVTYDIDNLGMLTQILNQNKKR